MLSQKKNRNKKGLALGMGPVQVQPRVSELTPPHDSRTVEQSSDAAYRTELNERLAAIELQSGMAEELRSEDMVVVKELGSGNGGTVSKVRHIPSNTYMAKKVVHISTSDATRKQIIRELQIMHECSSLFIVSFYGAYVDEPHVCMCMEFMNRGSLDRIYKIVGAIPELILGKIAYAVIMGLTYLYSTHKIMHRDVKPSNILLNDSGQVKICDFGVSGELINSVADTFVGTSTYMSPERISGEPYTIKSDVWSLGITLIELGSGRFPYASVDTDSSDGEHDSLSQKRSGVDASGGSQSMTVIELLQYIVNEPPPKLPAERFSQEACLFVSSMLLKESSTSSATERVRLRPTPRQLLSYPWMAKIKAAKVDMRSFAQSIPD